MTTHIERGAALKAAREAKPWTQAQLAEAAGVSTRTVIRAELGGEATAETLLALCGALGIDSTGLPKAAEREQETPPPEQTIPQSPSNAAAEPRVLRIPAIPGFLALAGLAILCILTFHVAWAGGLAFGLRDAPTIRPLYDRTLAVSVAQDLMKAAKAVADGAPTGGGTWESLFRTRSPISVKDCKNLGFWNFVLETDDTECPNNIPPPTISVAATGPTLVDVTVGPMQKEALYALARMLPRDPALNVTASYAGPSRPGEWGSLRFAPATLAHDQVPFPGDGPSYLNVRIEPGNHAR